MRPSWPSVPAAAARTQLRPPPSPALIAPRAAAAPPRILPRRRVLPSAQHQQLARGPGAAGVGECVRHASSSCGARAVDLHALATAPVPREKPQLSALADRARRRMRWLAHPVVLVHTPLPAKEGGGRTEGVGGEGEGRDGQEDADPEHFALVSSFTTVALHPRPAVSFNLKVPSRTLAAIARSGPEGRALSEEEVGEGSGGGGYFTVTALADPAVAARFFGGPRRPQQQGQGVPDAGAGAKEEETKRGVGWKSLREASSFMFHCQLLPHKCVEVGDHVIAVGEVLAVEDGGVYDEAGESAKHALVYCDGALRGVTEAEREK